MTHAASPLWQSECGCSAGVMWLVTLFSVRLPHGPLLPRGARAWGDCELLPLALCVRGATGFSEPLKIGMDLLQPNLAVPCMEFCRRACRRNLR